MKSMYNTFLNKNNRASSHFGIGRDGSIVQYVHIKDAAWTQGKIQFPTAPIIKQLGGDPNKYAVSIEHEGYASNGLDGNLTEAQFYATCWLHKHIQTTVERIYNVKIPLNGHQVIGHYQIDSKGKPYCPGLAFPWAKLYAELSYANDMTLEQYTERINYLSSQNSKQVVAYAFSSRVRDLEQKLNHPTFGPEARRKLMMLEPIAIDLGLTEKPVTAELIVQRVAEVYKNSHSERFVGEAMRKLLIGADYAKSKGLL